MRAISRLSALPALTLLLAACGGEKTNDVQPVINSFTLSKNTVSAGEVIQVAWDVTGADKITILQGTAALITDDGRASGSVDSSPIDTALAFTLTAVNSESGKSATETASILGVAGIRIAEFTATPATVDEDQPVTLAWRIGGEVPTEVVIKDAADVTVHDEALAEGSVQVVPEAGADGTATYTLSVRGASGMDEKTVTITVNQIIDTPIIVDFSASSTNVAKGNRAQLRWELEKATEVQITLNGVVARPYTTNGVPTGNVRITVTEDVNTFVLEAKSEDDVVVTQELVVNGLDVPEILTFDLSPLAYTQASTVATITWDTAHADSTNLQLNGRDVANFPRTQTSGTFQFNVTGRSQVTLVATNPVQDTTQTKTIELGFDDNEPNDSAPQAIPLNPDGRPVRGTVSDLTDTDWYMVMVPEGAYLYAQVGYDAVSGCSFDTILRLYDSDGSTELGFADNTTAPNISPCSEINPIVDNFASGLAAGVYYLAVGGSGVNSTGQYSLTVRVVTPTPALTGITGPLEIGDPKWSIADFVQFSGPIDINSTILADVLVDEWLAPMHSSVRRADGPNGPGTGFAVVTRPDTPHHPDYANELRLASNMRGITMAQSFAVADVAGDNERSLYFGFTLVPRTGTATTGATVDFADGPIIENALFPIAVDMTAEENGNEFAPLAVYDMASYGTFTPPIAGDGSSHRHVIGFAPFPATAPTGNWEWVITLLDSSNAGWTVRIPFQLN